MSLRLISWNLNQQREIWSAVRELAVRHRAQAALVQEARPPIPDDVVDVEPPVNVPWRWHLPVPSVGGREYASAIALLDPEVSMLARQPVPLPLSRLGQDELVITHPGQFAVAELWRPGNRRIVTVSLYGIWERMDSTGWIYAEATLHRAISDLTGLLQHPENTDVVVAGDLNVWRGYPVDVSHGWQSRYESVFDRLATYGLEVAGPVPPPGRGPLPACPCGPAEDCAHVATYRAKGAAESRPYHNDWVLVSSALRDRVLRCEAIDDEGTWQASDHAPILLELDDRID